MKILGCFLFWWHPYNFNFTIKAPKFHLDWVKVRLYTKTHLPRLSGKQFKVLQIIFSIFHSNWCFFVQISSSPVKIMFYVKNNFLWHPILYSIYFLCILSSWVKVKLLTENQLPRHSGFFFVKATQFSLHISSSK